MKVNVFYSTNLQWIDDKLLDVLGVIGHIKRGKTEIIVSNSLNIVYYMNEIEASQCMTLVDELVNTLPFYQKYHLLVIYCSGEVLDTFSYIVSLSKSKMSFNHGNKQ